MVDDGTTGAKLVPVKVVATWIVSLLVVIGIGVGIEGGAEVWVPVSKPSQSAYHARSVLAREIDQIAVNAAAGAGDAHIQSVTWVETCITKREHLPACAPEYEIEIPGQFVLNGVPELRAGDAPHGTVLWIELGLNLQGLGVGVGRRWTSLTVLGRPETDNLVGLQSDRGQGPVGDRQRRGDGSRRQRSLYS